jgi:D-alanine--poly(phosphoribitol) ligase subunit 2
LKVETKIQNFLEATFLVEFDESLTRDSDLFKEGVMDSFGYLELIAFLKSEFQITLSDEELATNVLVDLRSICAFVAERQGRAADAASASASASAS